MIEQMLIEYLSGRTEAGNDVFAERPEKIPQKYILIEKTGGGKENYIKHSTVAIQSISDSIQGGTLLDAMMLNEKIKVLMERFVDLDEIGSCDLNSDYNYTDTSTKEYRYQAVFDITHY